MRIKANPLSTASVYVDGALVGKVEDLSGQIDRLSLEGGRHVVEVRAEGYVPKSEEVNVKVDTTHTVRISLKKKEVEFAPTLRDNRQGGPLADSASGYPFLFRIANRKYAGTPAAMTARPASVVSGTRMIRR